MLELRNSCIDLYLSSFTPLQEELLAIGADYGLDTLGTDHLVSLLTDGVEEDEETESARSVLSTEENIESVDEIKSLQEINSIKPIKNIHKISSIQEIKSMKRIPDSLAHRFIQEHNLKKLHGDWSKELTRDLPLPLVVQEQQKKPGLDGAVLEGEAVNPPINQLISLAEIYGTNKKIITVLQLQQKKLKKIMESLEHKPEIQFKPESEESSEEQAIEENSVRSSEEIEADEMDEERTVAVEEVNKIIPVKSVQEIVDVQEVTGMYKLTDWQAALLKALNRVHS